MWEGVFFVKYDKRSFQQFDNDLIYFFQHTSLVLSSTDSENVYSLYHTFFKFVNINCSRMHEIMYLFAV